MEQGSWRIAIVCQPWDAVAPNSGSSIPIIAYALGHRLCRNSPVTIYGRRSPGQKRREFDAEGVEFRRFTVFRKPWILIEALTGIPACYTGKHIGLLSRYSYHFLYALRVALSIRASRANVVLVFNFLQFASFIKLLNPSTAVFLYMQCDWLTQFASASSDRRLRRIDMILGCSAYVTEAIKAHFPAVGERCRTLHNGVDTELFRPAQAITSDDAEQLLFVGRVSPEKGVHVLLEAFQLVAASRPKLQLHLVGAPGLLPYLYLCPPRAAEDPATASLAAFYGDGIVDMVRRQLVLRARGYLNEVIAKAASDKRIVFHGVISQADTISFYHRAKLLVFPSVWNEPFGMPTIEAGACGLPVIATVSGGIPEIVEHGRTGMLVPRGDARQLAIAIGQMLDASDRRSAMGEAGRKRAVECFRWDAIAQRLTDLIAFAVVSSTWSRARLKTCEIETNRASS